MISCNFCGQSNADAMRFCRGCGKPLPGEAGIAPESVASMASQYPPYVQPPIAVAAPPPANQFPVAAAPRKGRYRWLAVLLVIFLAVGAGTVVTLVWAVKKGVDKVKGALPVIENQTPQSAQAALGDLYYPGSVPKPGIKLGGVKLITMESSDPISKVLSYYKSKLNKKEAVITQENKAFTIALNRNDLAGYLSAVQNDDKTEINIGFGKDLPNLGTPENPK